jgi:hypothetical protein
MRFDDLIVLVIGAALHPSIAPTQLSGHAMEAPNQIVLAHGTPARLHKRVGDSVEAGSGAKRNRLTILGPAAIHVVPSATPPRISIGSSPSARSCSPTSSGHPRTPLRPHLERAPVSRRLSTLDAESCRMRAIAIPTFIPTTRDHSPDETDPRLNRACSADVSARTERGEATYTIFEGTSEIQRVAVARAVSGLHIP